MLAIIIAFYVHFSHFDATRLCEDLNILNPPIVLHILRYKFAYAVELFFMLAGFCTVLKGTELSANSFNAWLTPKIKKLVPLYWLTLTVDYLILYCYYFKNHSFYGGMTLDALSVILSYLGIEHGWFSVIVPRACLKI